MKPILEIKNISKKFRIRHETKPYLSLRDSLSSLFKPQNSTSEDFYALKDVSFNVYAGESIGIIGRNGAGKSTLLKILSKITPPSCGKIISRGRIASLLEVGTGFHAELSGRENIFLNGSILGMKRKEIQDKFDAIVDFSGVERFLDTPLKHYSSGMQLRLAFAVAAFLEPEILIIDEILAVGDAEFQKKCLGKMEEVSHNEGRTVLFVSHNLSQIENICSKGILLKHGKLLHNGSIKDILKLYLDESNEENNLPSFFAIKNRFDNQEVNLLKVEILDSNFQNKQNFKIGELFCIKLVVEINEKITGFSIGIKFKSEYGINIRTFWTKPQNILPNKYEIIFKETNIFFGNGKFIFDIELLSRTFTIINYENAAFVQFQSKAVNNEILFPAGAGYITNSMDFTIKQDEF